MSSSYGGYDMRGPDGHLGQPHSRGSIEAVGQVRFAGLPGEGSPGPPMTSSPPVWQPPRAPSRSEDTRAAWLPTAFAKECSLASSTRNSPQVSPSAASALSSAGTMFPKPMGSPMSPQVAPAHLAASSVETVPGGAGMWFGNSGHGTAIVPGPPSSSLSPTASVALDQRFNDITAQSAAQTAAARTLSPQPTREMQDMQPLSSGSHSPASVRAHTAIHARSLSVGGAPHLDSDASQARDHSQDDVATDQTRVLALPPHCPPQLLRKSWSVKQFNLEKVLYVGNISRVLRAVDGATGMTVALKVYKRHSLSDMEKYQVAREIRMHSELYHQNIISLYCAWKDSQYIHVAVEWAPNGDIYSMLKRFGGNGIAEAVVVSKIFRPLLSALSFIHVRGLIHRDLKPENILLGPNFEIKLSDFGLSINQYHEVANTRLGTLNYIAPEILQCPYKHHPLENKGLGSPGYDNKVDVWSLGVLAFELLTAQLPFCGDGMRETLQKIMLNQVVFPNSISPLARDFIALCLQSDAKRRPTIDHLQQHPWVCSTYEGEDA